MVAEIVASVLSACTSLFAQDSGCRERAGNRVGHRVHSVARGIAIDPHSPGPVAEPHSFAAKAPGASVAGRGKTSAGPAIASGLPGILAVLAACAPGFQVIEPPGDAAGEVALQRPAPGDPRRYDLDAWGADYLLEFRSSGPFEPRKVLRVYPTQTVCAVMWHHRSLFRFREGSSIPDEGLTIEPAARFHELQLEKARFEVLGAEKTCLGRGQPRVHLQVVGSASRSETRSPDEAMNLSRRRALAVSRLVHEARPDLEADQVDLMALGWDGFATPGRADGGVVFVPQELSTSGLPSIFVGARVPDALQERLKEAVDGGRLGRNLEDSASCEWTGDEEREIAAQRWSALVAPLLDALESGCRLPARALGEALSAYEATAVPPRQADPLSAP